MNSELTTIANLLREKKQTLCTAESCTGGYIAHLITSISGSSDYFVGGVVAYSNEVKQNILGVKAETIEKHGAVSEQTVTEMALGALTKFKTDYAIAVTGIAGPTGGTAEKPVGTVWIAIARCHPELVSGYKQMLKQVQHYGHINLITQKFLFGNNRERNIQKAANAALNMLRKEILNS